MRDEPLLLLLDEPTAAPDVETEHALFERYATAARGTVTGSGDGRRDGRITILVSHRFSTVRMYRPDRGAGRRSRCPDRQPRGADGQGGPLRGAASHPGRGLPLSREGRDGGTPMQLAELAAGSRHLASTRSRREKIERLAGLLRRLRPEEIEIGVSYLTGRLRQKQIGVSWAALRDVRPAMPAAAPALSLREIDAAFQAMAEISGKGSTTQRRKRLADLLARCTGEEIQFVSGLVTGELRQGALEGLMVEAVAEAIKAPARDVRRAVMLAGDLREVASRALREGPAGLAGYRIELFRPVQPMLASPAEDMDAAFERMDRAMIEYKLDGARIQVHRDHDDVRVFSRQLNDVTAAVPELVERVRALPVRSVVLDGETLVLGDDGRPRPFQVTMRRFGRRLQVEELRKTLPLTSFFFDLLHLDEEDLIDSAARDRSTALRQVAAGLLIPQLETADAQEAQRFLAQALDAGHEGVMAKDPLSVYEAGHRGFSWLKIKPAHTLDLVVLAVERGSGRRRGWLSNIHLGARDPGRGFVMLGKTFKGMTDEMLAWQTERFQELKTGESGHVVHLKPEIVCEVAFGDIQQSPRYPSGMALRFARVKRYRPDKRAEDADTIETVRAICEGRAARRSRK